MFNDMLGKMNKQLYDLNRGLGNAVAYLTPEASDAGVNGRFEVKPLKATINEHPLQTCHAFFKTAEPDTLKGAETLYINNTQYSVVYVDESGGITYFYLVEASKVKRWT